LIAIQQKSYFSQIESGKVLQPNLKKGFSIFWKIVLLSIPFYGIDIFLCISKGLWFEATAVTIITILNIFVLTAMQHKKKYFYFVLFSCVANCAIIAYLTLLNGFLTGTFFYYLPGTIILAIYAAYDSRKILQGAFITTLLIFVAAIVLSYQFAGNKVSIELPNTVFVYRLAASLMLSSIMLWYFLPGIAANGNNSVSKNYFDALFQSPSDAFIVFDKQTREIIDYNTTTSQLFELPMDSKVNGLYISQFMMRYLDDNSDNFEVLMDTLPADWQGEGNFKTHSKRPFTAFVHCLSYTKDESEYQILCVRDITKIKIPMDELDGYKETMENSTRVKTRFLSSMSHELRTPLNGIIGTSNLLLEEPGISDSAKAQLKLQLYSSEHMLSIINDILDFSKIDSGKMELNMQPFNLLDVMSNLVSSFEGQFEASKIKWHFEYDQALAAINVVSDEVKLRQILSNLISNALKFTLEGSVTLTINVEKQDEQEVTLLFKIKDTGIGINKDKHTEIFDGFSQVHAEDLKRRFGGTGLGLTISQKLAGLFGGSIKVDSELGKGSCFYFSIKLKNEKTDNLQITTADTTHHTAIDIRGIKVLIVEDNEINAAVLNAFLSRWEIRTMEAANGLQALELMKYHKFDLIFMDLEMPEMNGYVATKIIRETNTGIPVIAFTATLLENMESLITQSGFNDYILKPFKPADLKRKIEKYAPHRKFE
jgi:signal transduction histidine kinase/ActR/RegA family two-component response regulator